VIVLEKFKDPLISLLLKPENLTKKASNKKVECNTRLDNNILSSIENNELKIKINPI